MSFAGWLEAGGWAVWLLLALALPGLVLGVLALGLSGKSSRHYVGLAALALSATLSLVAIGSTLSLRAQEKAVDGRSMTSTAVLRARRAIAIRSKIPLRVGFGAALIPLLGGITGALSIRRARKGRPQSTRSLRAPVAPRGTMTGAVVMSVVAGASAAAAAALLLNPLPGPALSIDSPAWAALEAIELLKSGSSAAGCEALEKAAGAGGIDAKAIPDVSGAVSECFELRFDEAASAPPQQEAELLEALGRTPLPLTRDQRARLESEQRLVRANLQAESITP